MGIAHDWVADHAEKRSSRSETGNFSKTRWCLTDIPAQNPQIWNCVRVSRQYFEGWKGSGTSDRPRSLFPLGTRKTFRTQIRHHLAGPVHWHPIPWPYRSKSGQALRFLRIRSQRKAALLHRLWKEECRWNNIWWYIWLWIGLKWARRGSTE